MNTLRDLMTTIIKDCEARGHKMGKATEHAGTPGRDGHSIEARCKVCEGGVVVFAGLDAPAVTTLRGPCPGNNGETRQRLREAYAEQLRIVMREKESLRRYRKSTRAEPLDPLSE